MSRYQIYEAEKRAKKVKETVIISESPKVRKAKIMKKVEEQIQYEETWTAIFAEEFSHDELQKIEKAFEENRNSRTIETPIVQGVREKIGLAKFQGVINESYQSEQNKLPRDADYSKYLSRCLDSECLEWLIDFQNENALETIQNAFNYLLSLRLSNGVLNAVTKEYNELMVIEIGNITLKKFVEGIKFNSDEEVTIQDRNKKCQKCKTCNKEIGRMQVDKICNTCKKIDALRNNSAGWNKLSTVLNSLKMLTDLNGELIVQLDEKELDDNGKLFKYLFELCNRLRFLITANNTLAKIVELFIIEQNEAKNVKKLDVENCVQVYKDFTEAKERALNKVLQAVKSLSKRPCKASWQTCHEYLGFEVAPKVIDDEEQEIDVKVLQKLFHIYKTKLHERFDWGKHCSDVEILECCLESMKNALEFTSAPLGQLIAWKNELNVKLYTETDSGQFICIREHFVTGTCTEHILLEDQRCSRLEIDLEFYTLHQTRQNIALKFEEERKNKIYCFPQAIDHSEDSLINRVCAFFPEGDRDELEV